MTELKAFVDGELPAHKFDRMIEVAAAGIGFQTFDVVAYRSSRLTRWQELFRLFADKEEAEQALQRAIGCELRDLFGTADRNKA